MSQQQQPGNGDDQEMTKLFICFIITAIIAYAIIVSQEHRVNAFIGAISWLHVAPVAYLVNAFPLLMDIPLVGSWFFKKCYGALQYLSGGAYAYMDGEGRSYVLTASGRVALFLYGGILIWIAFRGQDFRVDLKYKTRHTLESMIWFQSDMWLTSRLARHVNPLRLQELSSRRLADVAAKKVKSQKFSASIAVPRGHVSVKPATWNRAMRPEEWLLASGLTFNLQSYEDLKNASGFVVDKDYQFKPDWDFVDLESISEVLSEQLRAPWDGPEKLRPYQKVVYAIMALFYNYKIKPANALLDDIGVLADLTKGKAKKLDDVLLAEKGLMAKIDNICTGKDGKLLAQLGRYSAYVESAFPIFLAAARKDRGVLPSAAMLWLKAEDRTLWYIVNNVGNEAISVEAAGAIAHARAEQQLQKKMRRPAVYQAARAMLEDYLDMTPARIEARADKEMRSRTPGVQLDLIAKSILKGK